MSNNSPAIKSKVQQKKDTKISSADDLIKTSKSGDIALDEQELERVTGGMAAGTQDAMKRVLFGAAGVTGG